MIVDVSSSNEVVEQSLEEQEANELIDFLSKWGDKYGYKLIIPTDDDAIINDIMIDGMNKRIIFGELIEGELKEDDDSDLPN